MSAASDDTRDRLIALEIKVEHLTSTADRTAATVEEMNRLLQQAKGARWVIVAAASIGGFVAAKATVFMPWLMSGGK